MQNYRLATDENGSPFVLNSKGSIDFGYITEEMNLPPAPIRIAEGDERYGLMHTEQRHGNQIRDNGFDTTVEFVEYVSKNFDRIMQGNRDSCLLEVTDGKHNDTLFVRLVKHQWYWKVISGGCSISVIPKRKRKSTPALTTGHRSLLLTVKIWFLSDLWQDTTGNRQNDFFVEILFCLQIYQKTFKINGMADIYSSKYVSRISLVLGTEGLRCSPKSTIMPSLSMRM